MATTFDFGDGNGPVPANRHRNPDGTEGGWVADTATVEPTAYVGREARVFGRAVVAGHARVFGNARIYGHATVFGDAKVFGNAEVFGDAWVFGDAALDSGKFDAGEIDATPFAGGPKA